MRAMAALCAATVLSAAAAAAHAQILYSGDERNISVRDRAKPEYDPLGAPFGGFLLYPELSVRNGWTNNVLAAPSDEAADWFTDITGGARLTSRWSSHALSLEAGADARRYDEFDTDDVANWHVGSSGRLDIVRGFAATAEARFSAQHEPRTDTPETADLAEPVSYEAARFGGTLLRRFNRLQVSARAHREDYDFDDAALTSGGMLEQDDRDRTVDEIGARVDLTVGAATRLFAAAAGNRRDFSAPTARRDSTGGEALFGAAFDVTNLVRGEVSLGYLEQTFDAAGADSLSGVTTRSSVQWLIDPLVTISLAASRDVQDAGVSNATGYLSSGVEVAVDYEYRRNVVVGLALGYSQDDYRGVDREDWRSRTEASLEYALNRDVLVGVSAASFRQDSGGAQAGREYVVDRAMVTLSLRR